MSQSKIEKILAIAEEVSGCAAITDNRCREINGDLVEIFTDFKSLGIARRSAVRGEGQTTDCWYAKLTGSLLYTAPDFMRSHDATMALVPTGYRSGEEYAPCDEHPGWTRHLTGAWGATTGYAATAARAFLAAALFAQAQSLSTDGDPAWLKSPQKCSLPLSRS